MEERIMGTIVLQTLVTIVCAVLASSGFWAWLQKKDDKKSLQSQMLIGLAHDRIVYLGMEYIEQKKNRISRFFTIGLARMMTESVMDHIT